MDGFEANKSPSVRLIELRSGLEKDIFTFEGSVFGCNKKSIDHSIEVDVVLLVAIFRRFTVTSP